MQDLKSQLGPQWTPVNIAVMVILFIIAWPLGLAYVAYIIWGAGLGLDLRRPATFSTLPGRLAAAFRGAKDGFLLEQKTDLHERENDNGQGRPHGGTPDYQSDENSVEADQNRQPSGRAHRWPPRQGDGDVELEPNREAESTNRDT